MGTVVGSWRLRILLIFSVFMTCIYTVNGFFYAVQVDDEGYLYTNSSINYNDTSQSINKSADFMTILAGFGGFFTFENIDNPYARIFLTMVLTVCWITIGYILYTFIKEYIPFV